jgi:drug/metabolite transporter (DMT)-like permease
LRRNQSGLSGVVLGAMQLEPRAILARFFTSPAAVITAYAATVLIWGTTWLGIKISLTAIPPLSGAGLRFILAGLLLYGLALALRVDLRRATPPWHLIAVLAVTMFGINYALTYLAETHLPSGLVAVLFGTMPFFIFAFAHVMVGERAGRTTLLGALLALAGVALISLVGNVRGDLWYVVAAVVASASSGFANVYLKRFARAEPLATLPPAMLLAGVGLLAWGLTVEHVDPARALSPGSLGALLYLAAGGSALAFYLNHWLLRRIDSGVMGLSALMIPVIAVLVGVGFGGESFGPRDLAGALLVIGGVWLSLAPPRKRMLRGPRRAGRSTKPVERGLERELPAT